MIYSWLAPPRFYMLLGIGAFCAFVMGWFFLSQSDDLSDEASRRVVWKLPEDSQDILFEDIEFLKNKGFFGAGNGDLPNDVDQDLGLDQSWRALGVIVEGDNIRLLIKSDNGDVKSLHQGEKLPDERIITKIEKDMFVVEKEGESQEIRLFPMTKEEMRTDIDETVDAEDILDTKEEAPKVLRPKGNKVIDLGSEKDLPVAPPPIPQDLLEALEEDDDLF